MVEAIQIDDQPISSTFFGQGKWLTEFVTPDNEDVQRLYKQVTENLNTKEEKAKAAWFWVASKVKYVSFVKATLNVEGRISTQKDFWGEPSLTIHTKIGNCANKSFLLASLLRNFIDEGNIKCVFGNLCQNGVCGGHAWVEVTGMDDVYIMETTRDDVPAFIPAEGLSIYEPVIYFNDKSVEAVPGRTLLVPFSAVYADWLSDYINRAAIAGGRL